MGFKHWRTGVLAIVLLLTGMSSLILVREGKLYVSPDENANAFFSETFAKSGTLSVLDPHNVTLEDTLYPRSVVSVDGHLVPAGFLGLPIFYGSVGRIAGPWIIPILTPMIAAAAVLAWFGVVRRIFDRDIAFLSAILLAVFPGWWYYTARSLMPNVLFVSLLILSAWAVIARPVRHRMQEDKVKLPTWAQEIDVLFGGIAFGAALLVRPAEAWWMLVGIAVCWFFHRRSIAWSSVALFALSAAIALIPLPFLNQSLYGDAFTFGYQVREDMTVAVSEVIAPAPEVSSTPHWWIGIQDLLSPFFPFGIHPRILLRHVWHYGISLFWWMTLLATIGVPLLLYGRGIPKEARLARRTYGLAALLVAAYLAVLYGSWTFHDNPDPEAVTIANSYVRYWLPVFVLVTPFAAATLRWIAQRALTPFARGIALAALLLVCAALSVRLTFFAGDDGLVYVASAMRESIAIQEQVLEMTEDNAVVIVDRADKLFWPHRHVRYPLRSEATYALMPDIALLYPLYYYGITFPPQDMDYLNTQKLKETGLQIILLETFGEESLYRIYPSN